MCTFKGVVFRKCQVIEFFSSSTEEAVTTGIGIQK